MQTQTTATTALDVRRALVDERHYGFGLATITSLDPEAQDVLLDAVAARLTELGASAEDTFRFTNHKAGRWLVDHSHGTPLAELPALAAHYVTRDTFTV